MADSSSLNRHEFLQLFGKGAAVVLASVCLGGCSTGAGNDPTPASSTVDFAVDLTAASSSALDDPNQGYVYSPGRDVIVVKTTANTYLAFQAFCPHQGAILGFVQSAGHFLCNRHNAVFNLSGAVVSGPSPGALKQYTVTQTGTTLHVTS